MPTNAHQLNEMYKHVHSGGGWGGLGVGTMLNWNSFLLLFISNFLKLWVMYNGFNEALQCSLILGKESFGLVVFQNKSPQDMPLCSMQVVLS